MIRSHLASFMETKGGLTSDNIVLYYLNYSIRRGEPEAIILCAYRTNYIAFYLKNVIVSAWSTSTYNTQRSVFGYEYNWYKGKWTLI